MYLCQLSQLVATGAFGVNIDDRHYLVIRDDQNQPKVYINACPHLGIHLEMQPNIFLDKSENFIICANHGALFERSNGLCISGPCQGQWLQAVPCFIKNDCVWID